MRCKAHGGQVLGPQQMALPAVHRHMTLQGRRTQHGGAQPLGIQAWSTELARAAGTARSRRRGLRDECPLGSAGQGRWLSMIEQKSEVCWGCASS